jgi:O-acetylhomoserine/O-acetylserine sulfhydrylase-like pyridoxal-dependent enzyme
LPQIVGCAAFLAGHPKVQLSVGLEDAADIVADLSRALDDA